MFRKAHPRRSSAAKPSLLKRRALRCEQLEDRKLMAVFGGTIVTGPLTGTLDPGTSAPAVQQPAGITLSSGGQIVVHGTSYADTVRVSIDTRGTSNAFDDLINVSLYSPGIVNSTNRMFLGGGVTGMQPEVNITRQYVLRGFYNGETSQPAIRGIDVSLYGGNDRFENGSAVASFVRAGAGDDRMIGGGGRDDFFGEEGQDYLDGRLGGDYLYGGDGHDQLFGDLGDDTLYGGGGLDMLYGGAGSDRLYGDADTDLLDGGPGVEFVMQGGAGLDHFYDSTLSFPNSDFNGNNDFATAGYSPMGRIDALLTSKDVRWKARELYADLDLSRADMLSLYSEVKVDGRVTSVEHQDLKNLSNVNLNMHDSTRSLARKVAGSDAANARYNGQALGNLKANDTAVKLTKLVNKWFFGLDRPAIASDAKYVYVQGSLFKDGIQATDVEQGNVGDCYIMASLADVARTSPQTIQSMFVDNGDGTFAVRYYRNGVAEWVTVDRYLPVRKTGAATAYYAGWGYQILGDVSFNTASNYQNEFWAALAEKAYVQMDASGWIGQDGNNSYASIHMGTSDSITASLEQITGRNATRVSFSGNAAQIKASLIAQIQAGRSIVFESDHFNWGMDRPVVDGHAYSLVSYNSSTGTFRIRNPHGVNSSDEKPEYINASFNGLKSHFNAWHVV